MSKVKYPLKYPNSFDFHYYQSRINDFAKLKYEYGVDSEEIEKIFKDCEAYLKGTIEKLVDLPNDPDLESQEPDSLEAIRALRPDGVRKMWSKLDDNFEDRLAGAFIGRMAGCTLGAPVEFWSIDGMKEFAEKIGDSFPNTDYWKETKRPYDYRYGVSCFTDYTRDGMDGVPADDDITYTILGLLILEDYGHNFTIENVGQAWLKYLPYACTAEEVALDNLKKGLPATEVADIDNPFVQWIGADIRSDPWGYLAPGNPELAAEYAYRDAYISHRRNGIYGEMYFSAVISAAFATGDVLEALKIGLQEIPANCLLAQDINWALDEAKNIKNYLDADKAVKARFDTMSGVHTNINACLTIWGLLIGQDDFTKTIGETVAMGYDNDCTAATAGSIWGAAYGVSKIPNHWYRNFNNKVITYINEHPTFEIDDVIKRFMKLAEKSF